ncbi:unnamed protein product [Gadus morhua 'NCC']
MVEEEEGSAECVTMEMESTWFPQGDDMTPGSTWLVDVSGLNPATPGVGGPGSSSERLHSCCQRHRCSGLNPGFLAEVSGEAGPARCVGARAARRLLYGLDRAAAVPRSAALECASTLSSAPRVHRLGRPLRGGLLAVNQGDDG